MNEKVEFISKLKLPLRTQQNELEVNAHGVGLRFFAQEAWLERLHTFFPSSWVSPQTAPLSIHCYTPQELGWPAKKDWDSFKDHECFFNTWGGYQVVSQRDFAVFYQNPEKIYLICEARVSDGFFNFLRWLLPKYLLRQSKFVLHSSCVLLPSGGAILSTGPSGAGKSTLAGLAHEQELVILGDDMNIVFREGPTWFVEAGAIGQALQSPRVLGMRYPLRAIFSLQKSPQVFIEPLKKSKNLLLYSGIANLFWIQLNREEINQCQNFVSSLSQQIPFYNLNFNLTSEVWNYVENFIDLPKKKSALAKPEARDNYITSRNEDGPRAQRGRFKNMVSS